MFPAHSPRCGAKENIRNVTWFMIFQRKVCTVISALVLLGAVTFTLVAAYQWAGRLGLLNAGRDGQTRAWSTALAIILWLVWFFGTVAPT
jgi:hypothetical protein